MHGPPSGSNTKGPRTHWGCRKRSQRKANRVSSPHPVIPPPALPTAMLAEKHGVEARSACSRRRHSSEFTHPKNKLPFVSCVYLCSPVLAGRSQLVGRRGASVWMEQTKQLKYRNWNTCSQRMACGSLPHTTCVPK